MRIALAISGASGIILGLKTVQALAKRDCEVHLVISKDACLTAVYELGKSFNRPQSFIEAIDPAVRNKVTLYANTDFSAPMASGSCPMDASIIVPCSMATLAAVSCGLSDNLTRRLADVALKERRPLVLVPREAPFSSIHLENMLKLSKMGVVILPPMPIWYTPQKTLDDVEDGIVGKILQSIGVDGSDLLQPWSCEYQQRME